jgi:hypothetical protein
VDGITQGILLLRLEENLFRLCVAAISHVNVGFGHRIDFIGIDTARPGLAEIGLPDRVGGIDILSPGVEEDRFGRHAVTQRGQRTALLERRLAGRSGGDV